MAPFLHEVFKEAVEIWLPAPRSCCPRGAGDDQFQRLAGGRPRGEPDGFGAQRLLQRRSGGRVSDGTAAISLLLFESVLALCFPPLETY